MPDLIDRAQELEERHRADAIARRVAAPLAGQGKEHCTSCYAAIPSARAALGYCHCIQCASASERKTSGR